MTCETERGVCQLCYGRMLASGRMVEIGEAVGIIAAQSIGEPGTQLTMRTFHYGGTATRGTESSRHVANHAGKIKYLNIAAVENKDGETVAISRTGKLVILDERQREKERYSVAYGSHLLVEDGQEVEPGTPLVEWDPFTSSILTAIAGKVKFHDLVEGENVREEIDKLTGHAHKIVIEPLGSGKRIPTLELVGKGRNKETRRYQLPIGSHLAVGEGDELAPGDVLAKIPREMSKTKDITGGLPRVVELFEARKPKDPAVVSEIDGRIRITEPVRGQRRIVVEGEGDESREYSIPRYAHVSVQEDEFIQAGDPITEGAVNPHDILSILGEKEMQRHLVDKIQEVYRSQGVAINDKHIEVIVRQMMRFVKVVDPGDTDFLLEQQIPRYLFERENETGHRGRRRARHRQLVAARHHQGLAGDRELHLGRFLPGDHARAHRGRGFGQGRQPARSQGKRHRGPLDPRGHRRPEIPAHHHRCRSRGRDGAAGRTRQSLP